MTQTRCREEWLQRDEGRTADVYLVTADVATDNVQQITERAGQEVKALSAGGMACGGELPPAASIIYTFFLPLAIQQQGAANFFHAQAHVPAQPSPPLEDARLSSTDEDQERAGGPGAPPRQRTQAGIGKAGLPRITTCPAQAWPELTRAEKQA